MCTKEKPSYFKRQGAHTTLNKVRSPGQVVCFFRNPPKSKKRRMGPRSHLVTCDSVRPLVIAGSGHYSAIHIYITGKGAQTRCMQLLSWGGKATRQWILQSGLPNYFGTYLTLQAHCSPLFYSFIWNQAFNYKYMS